MKQHHVFKCANCGNIKRPHVVCEKLF
ncbi:50S ribosomal protein L32 [Bacteroidota bacterium]